MSINGGHRQPITDCSDLHIQFDGRDAVVKSEQQTIPTAQAATLTVRPHRNGGVQVVGWDQNSYSVTACKAASNEDGEAEVMLSQIHLNVSSGEVSTDGPSGENRDWTVYLLVRSPKGSTIDLETENGPLSLYSVDGKLTAHATNGPITIHDFTGDGTLNAVNGPITISGGSGSLRVHTQNGPISINLKGTSWSGAGISADAQNGPATLFVPSGYQSSFAVETSKYAPISCRAQICDNTRKTWDEDNRRIEFGSTPAMIHLSTVNGPVSVQLAICARFCSRKTIASSATTGHQGGRSRRSKEGRKKTARARQPGKRQKISSRPLDCGPRQPRRGHLLFAFRELDALPHLRLNFRA
jgi:hypothetical protein